MDRHEEHDYEGKRYQQRFRLWLRAREIDADTMTAEERHRLEAAFRLELLQRRGSCDLQG